jgi:rfaE bifunctional protein kinase chain/domain
MFKLKPDLTRLKNIISQFRKSTILVIGDLMLDRFILGTVNRISPEAPVPVVEVQGENVALGGAANVANNIISLGGKAFLAGVIGTDTNGDTLKDMLSVKGIGTDGLIKDLSRPTTLKSRIIAHEQQVARIDREKRDKLSKEVESNVIEYVKAVINKVKAVIISDYNKGVITPLLIAEIFSCAKENNKLIAVDPKEENFYLYKEPDIITPNQKEVENISGIRISDDFSLTKAAEKLMSLANCQALLITRGAKGMSLFTRDNDIKVIHIPTYAREVYDVTGAGDTVIATLTLSLSSDSSLEEAAFLANFAGGLSVGKLGTSTIDSSELLNSIIGK